MPNGIIFFVLGSMRDLSLVTVPVPPSVVYAQRMGIGLLLILFFFFFRRLFPRDRFPVVLLDTCCCRSIWVVYKPCTSINLFSSLFHFFFCFSWRRPIESILQTIRLGSSLSYLCWALILILNRSTSWDELILHSLIRSQQVRSSISTTKDLTYLFDDLIVCRGGQEFWLGSLARPADKHPISLTHHSWPTVVWGLILLWW